MYMGKIKGLMKIYVKVEEKFGYSFFLVVLEFMLFFLVI